MNISIHKQIIDLLEDAGMVGMTLNVSIVFEDMIIHSKLCFDNRNSRQLSVDSTNELSNCF